MIIRPSISFPVEACAEVAGGVGAHAAPSEVGVMQVDTPECKGERFFIISYLGQSVWTCGPLAWQKQSVSVPSRSA